LLHHVEDDSGIGYIKQQPALAALGRSIDPAAENISYTLRRSRQRIGEHKNSSAIEFWDIFEGTLAISGIILPPGIIARPPFFRSPAFFD
jgi:hypothetical protein